MQYHIEHNRTFKVFPPFPAIVGVERGQSVKETPTKETDNVLLVKPLTKPGSTPIAAKKSI